MIADRLLSRLEHVRQTAPDKWIARCPAHDDRHPSLAISEQVDGRVLIYCHALCSWESVLGAVGMDASALFPDKPQGGYYVRNQRRPFNPIDLLRCVWFETLVVAVAASNVAHGTVLTEVDRARLLLAAERLQSAVGVADGK